MKRHLTLLCAVLLVGPVLAAPKTPVPQTGARLSLIDIFTQFNTSMNRTPYFVEIQDVAADQVLKEYSVPYNTDMQVRAFAQDAADNWKTYQDTLHWTMMMALNSDVYTNLMTAPLPIGQAVVPAPPVDTHYQNCILQIPADLWGSLAKSFAGVDDIDQIPAIALPSVPSAPDLSNPRGVLAKALPLTLSQPASAGWNPDEVNMEFVLAPRVSRDRYCGDVSANIFPPDYIAAFMPGNLYEMAITTSIGPFTFHIGPPVTTVTNWVPLYERLNAAGTVVTKAAYLTYQKDTALSLAKNLPLAIHWDGAFLPSGGIKSGTTLAPFYTLPKLPSPGVSAAGLVSQHDKDLLTASKKDVRFIPYLNGLGLPGVAAATSVVAKGEDANAPGDPILENLKREVSAGTFIQQQKEGMTTFMHVWQQLDLVADLRPLIYWTPNKVCVDFVCTTYVTPNPISAVAVTPLTVTALPTNTIGVGVSTFSSFRYRYGVETSPEGHMIPGVSNHPVLRPDDQ